MVNDQGKSFKCPLCGSTEYIIRQGHARDNENLKPLECSDCGLVVLSDMNHITENFYADGHMHDNIPCDPELLLLQTAENTQRRFEQFEKILQGKRILDVGCGAGGFLLKTKNIASEVRGVEPEKSYKKIYDQYDLTVYSDVANVPKAFSPDIITMFHVLEHIPQQVSFLKSLRNIFGRERERERERELIIEVPHANDALLTYYKNEPFSKFTYWSCHLYLHTEKTLQKVAEEAGFTTQKIIQFQRYPLANHLHWLAAGKPGGQHNYNILNDDNLIKAYNDVLIRNKMCDTLIGIFSAE